ncbi:MAG: DUF2846 domain-containing protein [Deltaproteobacteria bacterium]|jgi:hypothetical protein|nr:DUF2846 domain-containing protein [Deltaproteobacteria bacterium]
MRKLMLILAAACLIVAAGCAPNAPSRADYVYGQPEHPIVADSETGLIYFMRESAFHGSGGGYFIFEDDQKIGVLHSGTYFIHKTTPGKHVYWAETETRVSMVLNIQPEQTYYVEVGLGAGIWLLRPEFHEITAPLANKLLPDLKYIRLSTEAEAAAIREGKKKESQRQ